MIRLLIGGSPCTWWSIAQKNNRETEASGIGWELFKNYLIAKEKFKPDYFLYENNVSAAQPIKDEIKKQLGVWDGTFLTPYTDVRYIEINSALVSAQNRERFYVHNCGEVGQPKDRGILLKDVLGSGCTWKDKQNTIDANYFKGGNFTNMQKQSGQRFAVAEPVIFQQGHGYNDGGVKYGKCPTLTASPSGAYGNQVVEPIRIPEYKNADKSRPLVASYAYKGDGDGSLLDKCFPDSPNKQKVDYVAESIRVGAMPRPNGELSTSQALRVYSVDGKATTINHGGGGAGGKTGLYAIPLNDIRGKSRTLTANYWKCSERDAIVDCAGGRTMCVTNYNYATEFDSDGKPTKAYCYADSKIHTVYEVKDGKITIKGKEYPIKLPDGFYIIRKLTVAECRRLQTIPEWYKMPCSDTQNYKMLGNGWTVEVIKHILSHIPNITTEPIEVLSMYDGMSCGQIALKELGANVVKYYATEIDKYAIQTTQANFPDTVQLGDAFQVRDENWMIGD